MCVCVCVCVCVSERERERVCVCERERECCDDFCHCVATTWIMVAMAVICVCGDMAVMVTWVSGDSDSDRVIWVGGHGAYDWDDPGTPTSACRRLCV